VSVCALLLHGDDAIAALMLDSQAHHTMTLISGLDACRGYAVQTGKLTLDLSNMRAVQLGARGIATIEAGARLGPIYLVRAVTAEFREQ
jgi:hypothetical protein